MAHCQWHERGLQKHPLYSYKIIGMRTSNTRDPTLGEMEIISMRTSYTRNPTLGRCDMPDMFHLYNNIR